MGIVTRQYRYDQVVSDQSVTEVYTVSGIERGNWFQAINAEGLPQIYDRHPLDNTYVVLDGGIKAVPLESNTPSYRVSVTYTKKFNSIFIGGDSDRLVPGSFKITSQPYNIAAPGAFEIEKEWDTDYSTAPRNEPTYPILNSAKEEFDPADFEETVHNKVISFTLIENRSYRYENALDQIGSINSSEITILGINFLKGEGLMRNIQTNLVQQGNTQKWHVTYTIEKARQGSDFWKVILDQGFYAIYDLARYTIKDSDINTQAWSGATAEELRAAPYISTPVWLNGAGEIQEGAIDTGDPTTLTPYRWRYRLKPYSDWNTEFDFITRRVEYV